MQSVGGLTSAFRSLINLGANYASERSSDANLQTQPQDNEDEPIKSVDQADVDLPGDNRSSFQSAIAPSPQTESTPTMAKQDLHERIQDLERQNRELLDKLAVQEGRVEDTQGTSCVPTIGKATNGMSRKPTPVMGDVASQGDIGKENEALRERVHVLEDECRRLGESLEEEERLVALQEAGHRKLRMQMEANINELTEENQSLEDQSAAECDDLRTEIQSLREELSQLLREKESYMSINKNLSTELEQFRERYEDVLADEEELRGRLTDKEDELKQQKIDTREIENERRATARTCNMLAEDISQLKSKNHELKELVESQRQVIAALESEAADQSEATRRAQECNCLNNGIIRSLELEHEETRKMLQACAAELRKVQGQQGTVRQRCDDFRDDVQTLTHAWPNSHRAFSDNNAAKPLPGPSGGFPKFATIGKPVDGISEFAYTPEEDVVRMVRGLNEQVAVVACTVISLAASDKSKASSAGKNPMDTYIRNRLQDILGDALFHVLQTRSREVTQGNDLSQVAWAVQAALCYLLSVFTQSWPLAPPLLLDDHTDHGTKWQKRLHIGESRLQGELRQPDRRIHEDMVSKTMLLVNEILAISGHVCVEDPEQTHREVDALWCTAERVAECLKDPAMEQMYGLLLANPGAPFDDSSMVLDLEGPKMDDDLSRSRRSWMIVVLCTKALGLERVPRVGATGTVLEKAKVAQHWL